MLFYALVSCKMPKTSKVKSVPLCKHVYSLLRQQPGVYPQCHGVGVVAHHDCDHGLPVVHINGDERNHDAALYIIEICPHQLTQLCQLLHVGLIQVHERRQSIGRL